VVASVGDGFPVRHVGLVLVAGDEQRVQVGPLNISLVSQQSL
jgi:hypothetical protein